MVNANEVLSFHLLLSVYLDVCFVQMSLFMSIQLEIQSPGLEF